MIRLFKVFFPVSAIALLASDAILVYSAFWISAWLGLELPDVFLSDLNGYARIAIAAACIVGGLYFNDLYSQFQVRSETVLVLQVCSVIGFALLVQALLDYLALSYWTLPKWIMIYGCLFSLVALPAWRVFFDRIILRSLTTERVLLLGTSPILQAIAGRLVEQPHLGMTVVGYIDTLGGMARSAAAGAGGSAEVKPASLPGGPLLGKAAELHQIVERVHPDRIVVGMTERRGVVPMQELLDLRMSGIRVEEAITLYEAVFSRVNVRELRPSQLVFLSDFFPDSDRVFWQGIYSWTLALVAFVVQIPIALLVAVLVKLTSRGPIFYRQVRVGKDGVNFTLYKFRSMYQNAEAKSGAVYASKNDPRVTPLGRWLRKLRLDELPQLINVLRGEMSIVGPRPERPEFVRVFADLIPYYRHRLTVKPGITGWAQINFRYGETLEQTVAKLEYDMYYVKNLTFSLDVYIMFQTIKVMLLRRGAQ